MGWMSTTAIVGASALGAGAAWSKIAGHGQDAGMTGKSGTLYGHDSEGLWGPGYGVTQNFGNALINPGAALKSSGGQFLNKVSGGRIGYDTAPIPTDIQGLQISNTNIGGYVYAGGFDENFADASHMPGEVIGGTLTNDERAMIQLMDPKDRARYLLQKRIQEKAEMAVLLSQLQSLRHQTAMSVINNIR